MPQREQLRLVFEALDEDERVRVIVLRAIGEHFSSGGDIKGFLEASPEHVSKLAWNIAAPARCTKPVIAANRGYCFGVGFEISLACDFRIVSETCQYALARAEARPDPRLRRLGAAAEDGRHHPHQGHRDALAPHPRRRPMSGAWPPNACPTPSWKRRPTALVDELRGFSPLAQRTAKKLLNDTEDSTSSIAIELEGHSYSAACASSTISRGRRGLPRQARPEIQRALSPSARRRTRRAVA
jgi:2-oxoglutaroyl-CoA hydrolase